MQTTNLANRRLPHLETAFPGPAIEEEKLDRSALKDQQLIHTANHLLAVTAKTSWRAMKGLISFAFEIPRIFKK